MGFDTSSKIRFKAQGLTALPSVATTERIEFKGQIFAAASQREYLFIGDTVYVQADKALTVGQDYAITKEPAILSASRSDRPGYSYPNPRQSEDPRRARQAVSCRSSRDEQRHRPGRVADSVS